MREKVAFLINSADKFFSQSITKLFTETKLNLLFRHKLTKPIGKRCYHILNNGRPNRLAAMLYNVDTMPINWGDKSKIYVEIGDRFGMDIYENRRSDTEIYDQMVSYDIISPGDTVVDLGSHWGSHSISVLPNWGYSDAS